MEQTSTPALPATPRSISIQTVDGTIVITNSTGVQVRVKNIPLISGRITGWGIGSFHYQAQIAFNGTPYPIMTCTGLGSLGTYPSYGNPAFDPCQRPQSQLPKNELLPGETMILYLDIDPNTPIEYPYQPGSIVEVATGADVLY